MDRLAKQWSMKEIGYICDMGKLANEMILNIKFIVSNKISELLLSSVIMFCQKSLK